MPHTHTQSGFFLDLSALSRVFVVVSGCSCSLVWTVFGCIKSMTVSSQCRPIDRGETFGKWTPSAYSLPPFKAGLMYANVARFMLMRRGTSCHSSVPTQISDTWGRGGCSTSSAHGDHDDLNGKLGSRRDFVTLARKNGASGRSGRWMEMSMLPSAEVSKVNTALC